MHGIFVVGLLPAMTRTLRDCPCHSWEFYTSRTYDSDSALGRRCSVIAITTDTSRQQPGVEWRARHLNRKDILRMTSRQEESRNCGMVCLSCAFTSWLLPFSCSLESCSADIETTRLCTCVSDLGAKRSVFPSEAGERVPKQRLCPHSVRSRPSLHTPGGAVL